MIALPAMAQNEALTGGLECGIDLVDIERIAFAIDRWGDKFLARVWTEEELIYCRGRRPELAARFAAKEATSKALGTGFTGLVWRDIEVLPDGLGKPILFLHGGAQERARHLGLDGWSISLSHSRTLAAAVVIAWRGNGGAGLPG